MYLPDGLHRPSGFFLSFPTHQPVRIFALKTSSWDMAVVINTPFNNLYLSAMLPEGEVRLRAEQAEEKPKKQRKPRSKKSAEVVALI